MGRPAWLAWWVQWALLLAVALVAHAAQGLEAGDIVVSNPWPVGSGGVPAVLLIDPTTGDRITLSGCDEQECLTSVGTGPDFLYPTDLALEGGGASVVVLDSELVALYRVDPETGDRTLLSGCENALCSSIAGAGPMFHEPQSVAAEPGGGIVVTDLVYLPDDNVLHGNVLRVDPVTGDRTLLSGCLDLDCTSVVGTGPELVYPTGIAHELGGSFLVARLSGYGPLIRVDGVTGDRTIAFDPAAFVNFALGVALEKNGLVLSVASIAIEEDTLWRLGPESGDRVVLSGCDDPDCTTTTGTGATFDFVRHVAVEEDLSILVTRSPGGIVRIDPTTGDRTLVSGCDTIACPSPVGTGPLLAQPNGIAVVPTPFVSAFGFEGDVPGAPPGGMIATAGNVTVEAGQGFSIPTPGSLAAEGDQLVYMSTGPGATGAGSSAEDRSGDGNDELDVASMVVDFEKPPGALPYLALAFDVLTDGASAGSSDPFEIRLDGVPVANGATSGPNGAFSGLPPFTGVSTGGPDGSFFGDGRQGYRTLKLPVDPGPHTLEFFVGDESDALGDTALLVDDIRYVPEPGGPGTLLAGCALAGLLARRRASRGRVKVRRRRGDLRPFPRRLR